MTSSSPSLRHDDDLPSDEDQESLGRALADVEMLVAAYPEEVIPVSSSTTTTDIAGAKHLQPPPTADVDCSTQFPLQVILKLSDTAQCRLTWTHGYPVDSPLQIASVQFPKMAQDKARMEAALAALRATALECQAEGLEGGLACISAALQAWNDAGDVAISTTTAEDGGGDDNNGIHNREENGAGSWNSVAQGSILELDNHNHPPPSALGSSSGSANNRSLAREAETPWITGSPLTDRKSIFVAHVCHITREAQVRPLLHELVTSSSKMQRATHHMYAYRLTEKVGERVGSDPTRGTATVLKHDNDDDGEDGAGSRLAQLLEMRQEDGVLVVVSRWFGGIQLGPKRFAHITNVARQLLVDCHDKGLLPSPSAYNHSL